MELAIQLLDDTDFRFGISSPLGTMRVQSADFERRKRQKGDPSQPPAGEVGNEQQTRDPEQRRKAIKKKQKLNSKLADWSSGDEGGVDEKRARKASKIVILKHMFDHKELEEDPSVMLDLKQDVREECEKLGEVTNVILYDRELDGVMSVKFTDEDAAALCVQRMHGRKFDGRTVEAMIHDGKRRYRKTGKITDGEEHSRLEKFASWLEQEEGKNYDEDE